MLALVLAAKIAMVASPISGMFDRSASPFELSVPDAERIVVGKVDTVKEEGGFRLATLRVEKTLKGTPAKQIVFLASGTWACDESNANSGERILLITRKPGEHRRAFTDSLPVKMREVISRTSTIDNDGAGRFVIEKGRIAAVEYGGVLSRSYYIFPKDFPRQSLPNDRASISERDLIAHIKTLLATRPAP